MLATLLRIGKDHTTCEDALYIEEANEYVFGILADGCSSGINSEFASALMCKIFRQLPIRLGGELDDDSIIACLWYVRHLQSLLLIKEIELLSTLILFKYDKESKILTLRVFGDGLLKINDKETLVLDQNNTPDYLIYHINDISNYVSKYPILIYENVESFVISTDGPLSYNKSELYDSKFTSDILFNKPNNKTYLERMHNILSKNHWYHTDDVTIVSYDSSK